MSILKPHLAQGRAILLLGLPLMGSHLAQMALHVTDTVMLGWYAIEALAAAVLGASLFSMTFLFGSGFAVAVMGMVAAALGARDETRVRRDMRMALWLALLFGLGCQPLFWFSGGLLRALGQDAAIAGMAQEYLRIAGLGMVPALVVMVLKSYLSALGRAGMVLWTTLAAAGLNVVLNWALIFGHWGAPELGLRGAALASLGAQMISLVVIGLYAARHPALRRFHLFQRLWRPDWPAFWQVARLGLPVGLTSVAEGSLFNAAAVMMGWIGTVELAAHGIAMEVTAITFMLHLGLSNAATVRIGWLKGENDHQAMRQAARAGLALSLMVTVGVVIAYLTLSRQIIGAFIDRADPAAPQILAIGMALLAVGALFQLFDGLQCMALGLLRGVQDTSVPLVLAVVSYWAIGIPASYGMAFPLGLGPEGLWLGLVVGLVAASGLLLWRFWSRA